MATATKTAIPIQTSAANAAGGVTTSAPWNLATALGGVIQARISNGGTGPTLGCEFAVQISTDGVNWRDFSRQTAANTANTTYDFVVELPAPILQARVVFSGNTAQAVTVEALGHELTAIG